MRKHRFYFSGDLEINDKIRLPDDIAHHIRSVLRLKNNDNIFLFNNTKNEFLAQINDISKKVVNVTILNTIRGNTESNIKITLAQTLAKGQKMDYIVQKATELGVFEIIPLYSNRSIIKKVEDRADNKLSHWQKVAISACGQSERTNVPNIRPAIELNTWLKQCKDKHKLILTPSQNCYKLRDLNIVDSVTILIGPEGGFGDDEIKLAESNHFVPISMGNRILRTETAGVAAIAILQALFGDI